MDVRRIFISISEEDIFSGDGNCPVLMHSEYFKGRSGSKML